MSRAVVGLARGKWFYTLTEEQCEAIRKRRAVDALICEHPGWDVPLERGPTPISKGWKESL